jgi:hypothetical protein
MVLFHFSFLTFKIGTILRRRAEEKIEKKGYTALTGACADLVGLDETKPENS